MSQAGIINTTSGPVPPTVATSYVTDSGTAIPALNILNVLGGEGIDTSGAGNTVTISGEDATAGVDAGSANKGIASFDSAMFTVTNGFVQLLGGGEAIDAITVDASTAPGTNPVVPSVAGIVTITGAQVASGTVGTNVIRTNSTAANSITIEVQRSTAVAGTVLADNGVCHFDSTSFSVNSSGFVSLIGGGFTWSDISGAFSPLKNNGYFVTGTATATLPIAPSQGDTIKFFVDHVTQDLTIQASGTQLIRMGTLVSSAGGTALSTAQGDSVEFVYRSSNTTWQAVCGFSGTWVLA